jgi:hypothetical protein
MTSRREPWRSLWAQRPGHTDCSVSTNGKGLVMYIGVGTLVLVIILVLLLT